MKNREAGVLIEGADASPILEFLDTVYDFDFENGIDYPAPSYDEDYMEAIEDTSVINVPVPTPYPFNGVYVTTLQTVTDVMEVEIFTSPDDALHTVFTALNDTTESFQLYIYQVTSPDFCNAVQQFATQVPTFKMLVSNTIYDKTDSAAANECYNQLYSSNVMFYETELDTYTYSHQKYWILDGKTIWLSTGNWSPTDFPIGGNVYPPYPQNGWRNSNRDFNIQINHPAVVSIFQTVLDEDYSRGQQWTPSK